MRANRAARDLPDAASPSRPTLLRLEGLTHRFRTGTLALEGLDLEVRRGEVLTLLGPSGCGKSTVLRLIAGLLAPSAGRVVRTRALEGQDLGFVFQDPTLMPWATVEANVRLPLKLKGVPRAEARARTAEALAQVGLAGFGRAYPRELSGGMRMRTALARALVTRPSVLLMDEPFAAVDEITRQKLGDELLDLRLRLGWTIVFVTHSVFEAVYLSDRLLVMTGRPGRIAGEVPILGPVPRDEGFRASAAYIAACGEAQTLLKRTMPP